MDYLDQIDAWATSSKPVAVPVAAIMAACGEVRRLRAELAEAHADLEAYKFQIEGYSARLAEARDENRALVGR